MKKIIIFTIFFLFTATIAKTEIKNKILYNNKVFSLGCNLLEPLYVKTGNSDWCEYGTIWEIKEDALYLLGIRNSAFDSSLSRKKADLKELFGGKYRDGKVKAEWFAGELHIPDGKVFQQINNLCIFEKNIAVSLENGEITKTIIIDNTKKTSAAEKKSMLTAVIDPDKSIFGIVYGTTEDEFKARFGPPLGCRELGKTGREMRYGKKYVFLFEKTKLAGVYTVSSEYEVYQYIQTHDNFDNLEWKLSNGIIKNMNLAEVKKILRDEGLTTKGVISSLPVKTLDVTQKVINLPIEAVKKVAQVIVPSKADTGSKTAAVHPEIQEAAGIDANKPVVYESSDTVPQKTFNTTAALPETTGITPPVSSIPAKGLEIAAGLPEKTIDVTQKVINLPIEAVKKVTQAVIPYKSPDNEQGKFDNETGPKFSFSTGKAQIEIDLIHNREKGNIDEAFIVNDIKIWLK
ncbi:MAG: hypothetical protein AB1498_06330 [bacterium]